MHTIDSYQLKIRMAAALCAAFLFCACNHALMEEDGSSDDWEGEVMTVTLKVGTAAGEHSLTTKGLSDTQENAINTLYVLAFQKDESDNFTLKYYATGRPVGDSTGKFNFSLRRSAPGADDTKLLLVANHNPYSLVNTGMTYAEVQAALTSRELVAAPAFAEIGIPMFGFAGNSPDTPLAITEGMQPLSANLLRAVARVDVGVGTYDKQTGVWDKGSVNFELTEIHVFKPQNKYSLLPLINNLNYATGGTPSVTSPSPAGSPGSNLIYSGTYITNTTAASYCEAGIYLPEVNFGGGTVYDNDHANRMALVIGGKYNGTTNYYRIDFTTVQYNEMGISLKNVLRNHIYRYSITNVSQMGYTTAQAAYEGRPVGLDFKADMVDWIAGATGTPEADMVVRMNFGGINGAVVTSSEMKENGTLATFKILKKKDYFQTDGGGPIKWTPLYYNNMLGEAKDNTFNGVTNGGIYTKVDDALNREGPFGSLVIAPDNAAESVAWRSTPSIPKKDRVLDAKKACWDYRGQGRSDWRLPRLSELMLLWMNKETINISKGFTSLGDAGETYWTGSEGQEDKAYTVNRLGEINLVAKDAKHRVRCVREVK